MTDEPETVYGACNKCGHVGEMKRINGLLRHDRPGTDIECGYTGTELKGYGALKDKFEFREDIDLTKPIYAQTEISEPVTNVFEALDLPHQEKALGVWCDISSELGDEYTSDQVRACVTAIVKALREAEAGEREACAKIAENALGYAGVPCKQAADLIRGRNPDE